MMKTTIPKRFLTLRDRDRHGGAHRRSKSTEPGSKSRSSAADTLLSMFNRDRSGNNSAKAKEEEEEKEHVKMEELMNWVEEESIGVTPDQIQNALASNYASGNVVAAKELLRFQCEALDGTIRSYDPNVAMLGAENRGAVTCYLDSLLFAMFAKMEAFECMLTRREYPNEAQQKLAVLLRLWVNLLRSGKLIRAEMVEDVQDALAACGWADAKLLEQQDTSEAFAFITETLQLPLLTLQVDLFHQGKGDADDHKVVFERLLNLAVPADPEGKGVKLEDCLEEYFNTRVDVLRDRPDDKKGFDIRFEEEVSYLSESPVDVPTPKRGNTLGPHNTIRLVTDRDDDDEGRKDEEDKLDEIAPLQRRWSNLEDVGGSSSATPTTERPVTRPSARLRSTSIIQRVVLDAQGNPTDADASTLLQKVKRQGSTVVKAVTIPAWQFFKLIPWHSAGKDEPLNDTDVAKHLNNRPVVGICLKRYMMTEAGQPRRQNTFIDIPDSMRLPHFMLVNDATVEESNGLSAEFKLVLQSVVCHRGDSLHSGHYVAFSRVAPKLLTDNRRHDADPPPDYEDAQWVKFDDLLDERVTYVDDIKQSLKDEMPYLLFYQIVPMVDYSSATTGQATLEMDDQVKGAVMPPSYNDSTVNFAATTASSYSPTSDSERPDNSRRTSGYFDTTTTATSTTGPSIGFFTDLDRPPRPSIDIESLGNSSAFGETFLKPSTSRRGSMPFSDASGILASDSSQPPQQQSPVVTPSEGRLAKAAAMFKPKDKDRERERERDPKEHWERRGSRPASQAGEGRMSLTMSRLGGLMLRTSKEPLREMPVASSGEQESYEDQLPSSQHVEIQPTQQQQAADGTSKDNKECCGRKDSKDKGRGKHHHHMHRKSAGGEPERECVVM
ncbi:hypothetical protein MCOR27_004190 [Pyricularia oryzae]|nr:ubiquitin C-terminal hydrolase [Pyricularia oryzae 70-15]KAH8844732.1 hypothetical protein MCOR01_002001 [Pyricularia oryzae]KAI6296713.1 hypothetical protein MCOR33_006760 [Pyricularia grisea]EHA58456.1 ubiquitin C-terminal hydrolase [Pyricularia oryzae 70-15]KAH9429422.1 hypothetical protein MCOR02_010826 [Pyricularia oryzae]KAI6257810.1 hypothetical protein MCOR19_005755 [Pyricularia oryzae]